jgi:hypothetical protein
VRIDRGGIGDCHAHSGAGLAELLVMERKPLSFFLKGAVALAVLLLVTGLMEPRPEVNALRGMIVVGFAVIAVKVVLRRYNIDWPPRRERITRRLE